MKKILLLLGILLIIPFIYADTISIDDFECNGFNCGTGWNDVWSYTGTCEIVTTANPIGTYHMRGVSTCDALRQFDNTGYNEVLVSFYATATSLENNDHCQYYYYDGTSYHLLLDLGNGDDDGAHDYYEYDVTSYGLNSGAGIRMLSPTTSGDYCYIDDIAITGTADIQFNIFTDSIYTLSEITQIEMTSSLASTSHTIELYDEGDSLFCSDVIVSPASPFTSFYTECTMPSTQQTNAYAKLYETGNPGTITTKYFNVQPITQDPNMLQIKKVYFSPQVLQGGSTEIFILIEKDSNVTITSSDITLVFPDDSTRVLSVSPTENANEYRAFITDTYQTGNVTFTLNIEGGSYYDSYTNKYLVAGYNVDFVDVVNKVSEVAVCNVVKDIQEAEMDMFGTEYIEEQRAKLWLHLINENGTGYIEDAICFLHIYTPTNSVLLEKTTMEYHEDGVYYYDLVAPEQQGVYPAIAECYYDATQTAVYPSSSFVEAGTDFSGDYTNTFVEDGVTHNFKETTAGNPKRIEYGYNFTNMCGIDTSEELLTGITIHWIGTWASSIDDDITVHIYNYSSGQWVSLFNKIHSTADQQHISNTVPLINVTSSGLVSPTGESKIMFNDTFLVDGSASQILNDWVFLSCDELSTPNWQEIRGSSEMHITSDVEYVFSNDEDISVVFRDNTIYEGDIEVNFSIYSRIYEPEEVRVLYTLPYGISCDDIRWLEWYNESSSSWERWNQYHQYNDWHCDLNENNPTVTDLKWSAELEPDEVNSFSLVMKNAILRVKDKKERNIDFMHGNIDMLCNLYMEENGLGSKPSIPLTSIPNENNVIVNNCYHFWNNHYYFNKTRWEISLRQGSVDSISNLNILEEHFFRMNYYYTMVQEDYTAAIIGLQFLGMFHQDAFNQTTNPIWEYWHNKSMSHINWQYLTEGQMWLDVWNYTERTLTGQEHIWVGGTEYSPDEEEGKVVIRLVDSTDNPVDTADCILRVAYPNNTINFEMNMTHFNGTIMGGIYIADFTLPNIPGVYPYGIDCEIVAGPSPKHYYLLDTFHIFGANITKTAEAVWNYDNRTLTDYQEDLIATTVWNFDNRSLAYVANIVYDVWTYVTRELTNYQQESISNYVWNNTNRTLTEFEFDTTDEASVWNYNNRTLTEFEFDVEVDTSNITATINSTQVADAVWEYEGTIVDNILEQIASIIWEYLGARAEII